LAAGIKLATAPTTAAAIEIGKESNDQIPLFTKNDEIEFTTANPIPNTAKNNRPVSAEWDWVKVINKPASK
jgi:hypothetical protein